MAGRRHFPLQRGAALLMFLVLLVVAGLAYVVNNLTPEAMKARQERLTQEAMAQAKDTLIGYALLHRERKAAQDPPVLDAVYGYLPMPDLGEAVNQNAGSIPA